MKWDFNGTTVYGDKFYFQVKANDKTTAIQKGIEKVKAKFNCNTTRFDCKGVF